jgi:MYXO-CTERM domain-containing protein
MRRNGTSVLFGAISALVVVLLAGTAAAERPRDLIVPQTVEPGRLEPTGLAPYNTLFLNRCPSGCTVKPGGSNSITDSWGIGSTRTLTAFPYGDQAWADVVACVKDVMSPYVINVTDTDPGTAKHFEIMIAGKGTDLSSSWTNVGGIAPGGTPCSSYADNALVFAFAKSYGDNTNNTCDDACVNELCATAAQEIGHTWKTMDHVRLASDPMTYFGFAGRRYYQNEAAQCGSDCVDGVSPYGETCTGTNSQSHTCTCGGQTQNSYEQIKSLFGLGPGSPPTVKIVSPKLGENVKPGFPVVSDPIDDSGIITRVELKVDGMLISSLEKGPFVFNAPDSLANGTHRVEIVAYDPHQTPGTAKVDVVIGPPCKSENDCSTETDVCVGGRCVPGSGVNGGLGSTCAMSTDCLSNQCASDGTSSYCVEQCTVGQCPGGFGCLDVGDGTGACWPGYDDGSGGCGCQSTRGGPAGMMLALMVMVGLCRRRRR